MELRRLFNPNFQSDTVREKVKANNNSNKKADDMGNLEKAARQYLQDTTDRFPLEEVAKQVSNQVGFHN